MLLINNVELIGTLCTVLAIFCASDLLITGILTFTIPNFLGFTMTQLPTCAGVIAGFVAVPTVMRIRTSKLSSNINRLFGYTIWYQRLAISVCGVLHFMASLVTLTGVLTMSNLKAEMITLMKNYHNNIYAKKLVDNIQWALQCCGSVSYKDWFNFDWGGVIFDAANLRKKKSFKQLLREDTDVYPDFSTVRTDQVPFSCCSKKIMKPCVHQSLIHFGAASINHKGCSRKLANVVRMLLWSEFATYMFCFCLELIILLLLRPLKEEDQVDYKSFTTEEETKWSRFENESDKPQITPSSHSEVTLESVYVGTTTTAATTTTYPNSTATTPSIHY